MGRGKDSGGKVSASLKPSEEASDVPIDRSWRNIFGLKSKCLSTFNRIVRISDAVKGCYLMALSLSVHYIGYECARAASIALLSNKGAGLDSVGVPLTVVVGFPVSALTLYLYTLSIRHYGAKFTYRVSNFICCFVLGALSVILPLDILSGLAKKATIIWFYSFREIYVTLISTQQWSFIVSALDKTNSSLIVSIGGIVSVASTIGGFSVEQIVVQFGVHGLIMVASVSMFVSAMLSEAAFSTYCVPVTSEALSKLSGKSSRSNSYSNTSSNERSDSVDRLHQCDSASTSTNSLKCDSTDASDEASNADSTNNDNGNSSDNNSNSNSVWRSSWKMITQHETLRLLFGEAIVHQFCSNTLNLMFLDGLRLGIADDVYRAVVVGRFFACVNFCACVLQIFIVPGMLTQATLPAVICSVPIIVGMMAVIVMIYPTLLTVMFCFGSLKILEYAVITGATEMIYVPMSLEVRYVGKEFVRFFGQKGGKSVASVVLSAVNAHMSFSLRVQSGFCGVLIFCWCVVMVMLGLHLGEKNSAEEYEEMFEVASQTEGRNRLRLDSMESTTSKASIESLPDDDYFVGEGLSMHSDSIDPLDELDSKKSHSGSSDEHSSEGRPSLSSLGDEHVTNPLQPSSIDTTIGSAANKGNDKIPGTTNNNIHFNGYDHIVQQEEEEDYLGDMQFGYDLEDYNNNNSDNTNNKFELRVATHAIPIGIDNQQGAAATPSKLLLHTAQNPAASVVSTTFNGKSVKSSRENNSDKRSSSTTARVWADADAVSREDSDKLGSDEAAEDDLVIGMDSVDKLVALAKKSRVASRKRLVSADDAMNVEYVDVVFMDAENWENDQPHHQQERQKHSHGELRNRKQSSGTAAASTTTNNNSGNRSTSLERYHYNSAHNNYEDTTSDSRSSSGNTNHPRSSASASTGRRYSVDSSYERGRERDRDRDIDLDIGRSNLPSDIRVKVTRRPSTGPSGNSSSSNNNSSNSKSVKPQKSQLIRVGSHFFNLSKLKKFT